MITLTVSDRTVAFAGSPRPERHLLVSLSRVARTAMQLLLRSRRTHVITVINAEPHDTIEDVKLKIRDKFGTPIFLQCLKYLGTVLEDGRTLRDYGIQDDCTIHLEVLR